MSQRIPVTELPQSVVWAATELDLFDDNNTISRSHFRTLGEFLLRYGGGNSTPAPAKVTRTRTKATKAEVRSELTDRIREFLATHPGATLHEIAVALSVPLPAITTSARPVEWLVLAENELEEPTERVESQTISDTRDRARGALQAANLMASPLTHNAYTALLRSGRIQGPSVARIVQLFGSWSAACSSVGVSSGEALRSNYERTWDEEQLFGFVERFLREPVHHGASHQFDVWRSTVNSTQKVPSLGTVRNILGGTWGDIRNATLRRMRAAWAN
ncbi:MAG: hypothetical protein EXQ61_03860 [Ilumatobacteraceae bacterium]|nr:hypothetical protein [Ilumatobacteraceae bacterium]